jgi:hypothetical protein
MKKILAVLAFSFAFSTYAEDLPVADSDTKKEMVEYCKEMAEDESIEAVDLQSYLVECVNKELESEGYAPITKI